MPIIGAHVSTAGGYKNAIIKAEKIGAECIQIFGASPRSYTAKMPDKKSIEEYKIALKNSTVKKVFLHAAYLVNLASDNKDIFKKSVRNLIDHLQIAEMLGAQGLIFHIGSGKDQPREQALKLTLYGMKEVLKNVHGKTELIMENTAGSGQKIGRDAKELGWLLKQMKSKRVKVCVDTAHALEAGVIEKFTPKEVKKFLDEYDKEVGLSAQGGRERNISAFHINDSKTEFNSHHDKHENIGQGHIGLVGFKNLARDKRMKDMPWILEVPGFNGEGPDKKNVEILKRVCK